ncbi:hypothetical protein OH77DRAFT_1514920 [Trametes cingulata]|nr:hypothetical protein OH77DRAFT_1514920 [Trametes cingulata]
MGCNQFSTLPLSPTSTSCLSLASGSFLLAASNHCELMLGAKKSRGVSKSVRRHAVVQTRPGYSTSTVLTSKRLRQQDLDKEKKENQRKLAKIFSGLSGAAVEQICDLHSRAGPSSGEGPAGLGPPEDSYQDLQDAAGAIDVDKWEDAEGREDASEDMLHALRDFMGEHWKSTRAQGARTWRQRLEKDESPPGRAPSREKPNDIPHRDHHVPNAGADCHSAPGTLPPRVPGPVLAAATVRTDPVSDRAPTPAPPNLDGPTLDARDSTYNFAIDIVDMYSLARTAAIRRDTTQTTAIAMAEQGYLAASPVLPSLAITFNTLEHFRLLRLRKPSFSLEARKSLLPYRRRYRTALSDCFDVYLTVLRIVEKCVSAALNQDTPDWRVTHSCPACCYELDLIQLYAKLEDEAPLVFGRIFALDGNNSLKRVAKFGDRDVADIRQFHESDYSLPTEYVDLFKDEVKASRAVCEAHRPLADPDHSPDQDDEELSDNKCTRNWKAAGRDEDKKMWGVFDESGIFASACRHGFILWITDMIASGELAKYPIAIIVKALVVLGRRLLVGYDIGCTFQGTIMRSSLGPEFRRLECRCCVNAFHDQAPPIRDRRCRSRGPRNNGAIFSASNQLASVTRYASRFHQRVIINMFFKQWDDDKYANLANMLLDNYRQALKIIDEDSATVQEALRQLQYSPEDLAHWEKEETVYFASVGTEDPASAAAVEYVTLLRELRGIETQLGKLMSSFMTLLSEDYAFVRPGAPASNPVHYAHASETARTETQRRHLRKKWDQVVHEVISMEVRMGITTRWRPEMPEYISTLQYIAERDYQIALETLHGLVPTKFALQCCRTSSDAPRPSLDWSKVTHYTFLDKFELLRDTRNDICAKPWAQPLVRETMKKSRRVVHAHEEIVHCNMKIRCLHTSILDENAALDRALHDACGRDDRISGPLEVYKTKRQRVNARLLAVISQIHTLEGYTGSKIPGKRHGGAGSEIAALPQTPSTECELQAELQEIAQDSEDGTIDDTDMAEMSRLVNFALNVA